MSAELIIKDLRLISANLAESLHLDDVIYTFLEQELITLQLYDELMKSDESATVRAKHLLKYVVKNPHIINDFIKALLKEGLKDIAGHISPSTVNSFLPSLSSNSIKTEVLPFLPQQGNHPCIPGMEIQPLETPCSPTLPDIYNHNITLKVKVKSSSHQFGNQTNSKDIYKNCSNPRGFIFIANFNSFDNNAYAERPGSNVDVKNLKELFGQMGYNIVGPYINPTKFELIKSIENFCSSKSLCDVDSCIVVIMSHGKGIMSFVTSDNKLVQYIDILEHFNNKRCPKLFGKPKIFIFQCCRGPISDEGVGIRPQCVSYIRETHTDAAFLGKTMAVTSSPSFTDMYIIHSSFEGFVSYRCPDRGSWLIEAICIEFMDNACEKDLESLLRLVSRRLKSLYSHQGKKQICEIRNVGFDKLLYFNPISQSELSDHSNPQPIDETDSVEEEYEGRNPSKQNKRQILEYSSTDGVKFCESLIEYLEIEDMPDMVLSVKEIKKEIQTKKNPNKRSKTDNGEDQKT